MPLLSLNAVEMHYEHHRSEGNTQPPLLILSGMASDSASWQPVIAQLSTQHELLIPDNRCCGRTRPNPIQSSRSEMVADLIALLDALAIDRVNPAIIDSDLTPPGFRVETRPACPQEFGQRSDPSQIGKWPSLGQ